MPSKGKKPRDPSPYQMAAQKPLRGPKRFAKAHLLRDEELRTYIARQAKRKVKVSREVQKQLTKDAAKYLYATNAHARIEFVKVFRKHIRSFVSGEENSQRFFFVTLTPGQYAVALSEAAAFDVRRLQSWTWGNLGRLDFIGMVEAAHYRNLGLGLGHNETTVSWHVHLIAWGIDRVELQQRIFAINAKNSSLTPGFSPAHFRDITLDEVVKQTTYMSKAPMKEHSTYPTHRMIENPKTCRKEKIPTGKWKHAKGPYNRRGIAMMTNVMANQYLDKLLFAGGRGKVLAKAIREEALEPLRRYEQSQSLKWPSSR